MNSSNLVYHPPTVKSLPCSNSGCDSIGKHRCSRCLSVMYCSQECQKFHWKIHKINCKAKTSVNDLKKSLSDAEKKAHIIATMEKLKTLRNEEFDTTCDFCGNPTLCIDSQIIPKLDGTSTASAIFICKNAHTTTCSDACMGTEQECNCSTELNYGLNESTVDNKEIKCTYPSKKRFLIVIGFGPLSNLEKITQSLQLKGIDCDVIESDNGESVTERIKSGRYTTIMLYHLDEKSCQNKIKMFHGLFLVNLIAWVKDGGKFIMHGDGSFISLLSNIVIGKPWHFCGDFYRRCKQSLNRRNPSISTEGFSKSYSMKATMLSGVEEQDQIYSPKNNTVAVSNVPDFGNIIVPTFRTAIAASPLGSGIFCYIGDVNTEDSTVELITML